MKKQDGSTEERIMKAARKLFTQKGYSATKTRDIAAEAGINMALLHYYFRSKEKLFEIIMTENLRQFIRGLKEVLNNEETSLEEKIRELISTYIDMLIAQPDLPLFIFNAINTNPQALVSKIGFKDYILQSYFIKQFRENVREGKIKPVHPLHFLANVVGLTVFPFIGRPLLKIMGDLSHAEFNELMQERKELIPVWLKTIM